MKRFFKKSKKPSKPSQQPNAAGKPAAVAAGPPGFRSEQDLVPDVLPDEGGKIASRTRFQSGAEDVDQEPPASGAQTPSVAVGGESGGNRSTTGDTSDTGGDVIEPLEVSIVTKKACEKTSPRGARDGTKKFGLLKAALGAILNFYADHKESVVAENKIGNLLWRINALEERFDSPPTDAAEQRRRGESIGKVDCIEERLWLLSQELGSCELTERVQNGEDVFQLLEDLQGMIFHYQIARLEMTGDQELRMIGPAEATVLNNIRCAQRAEYRHGNRDGCLKGTRTAVLDGIELWTRNFDKPSVYWLNGLAGTGKSTIAQTIAERTFADGRLGASFFCSRDFEDRSNLHLIFPTLAVQLARKYADFRSTFIQLVRSDPEIVHETLCGQMKKLIVRPLVESSISTVIVIDALDECKDEEPASAILSVLGQFVAEIPTVKFFITGRPEPRIREGFRIPLLANATDVFVLHDVKPGQVDNDILLLFRHSFSELKSRRRGLDGWPSEEQVGLLCERAAGLFVHAIATVRFIDQRNSSPRKQLDRLLQAHGSALEGKTKFKANATLDSLYTSILQEAFGDDDPENDPKVRSVLGAIVLAMNPLSPSSIAALLGFEPEEVLPLLSSIHSLLIFQEDTDDPVRPFHKSFPDFVVDPTRCGNPRFRILPPDHHTELLVGCLEIMNLELERNMCGLPDGVINSEVVDLKERIKEHVSQALEYACRSWHKHLIGTIPAHVVPVLHRFFETKFLFWLEVLSVLGETREAVEALEATAKCKWQDVSPILDLVKDYSHFVIEFFEVISASAPHIYHSALLLSPQTSVTHRLYEQYASPFARVVHGFPESWEPISATVNLDDRIGYAAWSPCGKFIAIAKRDSTEIFDGVTLKRLKAFNSPHGFFDTGLSFTPDGRSLTQSSYEGLIGWDVQTGGSLTAIESGSSWFPRQCFSITYSMDGKMIAITYDGPFQDNIDDYGCHRTHLITIFDLFGTHIHTCHVSEERMISQIWAHGECFRFAILKPSSITIWEVACTSPHEPSVVESLPAPDEIVEGFYMVFLPSLSRLAFILKDTIQIWDAKSSKPLLKPEASPTFPFNLLYTPYRFWGSFSLNGDFFACIVDAGVYVWKDSPSGYILHQKVAFPHPFDTLGPCLSPDGESIIAPIRSTIHLWSTRDQILPPSNPPAGDNVEGVSFLAFSPNELFAAFAQGSVVKILDLRSGDLLLATDTDMDISCLWMTQDAVVAVAGRKIVSWRVPGENRGIKSEAGFKDSAQTITLNHLSIPYRAEIRHVSVSPHLRWIALSSRKWQEGLEIYDIFTGRRLGGTMPLGAVVIPKFTLDGHQIVDVGFSGGNRTWEIVEDSESGTIHLVQIAPGGELRLFPSDSSCGYEVTGDGWVLSSTQKRLLWVPQRWRSGWYGTWGGRFLGLFRPELSDVVILEFFE